MTNIWPEGFERIPTAEWTQHVPGELARKYDTVESHGWYSNLEPTVDELAATLRPGHLLRDYSGGTGIFADRLLHRIGDRACGVLIVDSSPKFLRLALALEKRLAALAWSDAFMGRFFYVVVDDPAALKPVSGLPQGPLVAVVEPSPSWP